MSVMVYAFISNDYITIFKKFLSFLVFLIMWELINVDFMLTYDRKRETLKF